MQLHPCTQVQGHIEITGVRWRECHAYLLEYQGVLCGNYGNFTGRKLPLLDFIEECRPMGLSVMGDGCGEGCMTLSGFRTVKNVCYEFFLEIGFNGEIIYFAEE